MARPKHAPIAIVGKNIPAGTYRACEDDEKISVLNTPTIMPNVQAVKKTFIAAVRISKKIFCHRAVGLRSLVRYDKYERICTHLHRPW